MNKKRQFDLWGVPFDGESSLGWPGSRYAPARVRECARWINMRIQQGRVYCLETDSQMEVGEQLLVDRGDISVILNDTLKTFDATSQAVQESIGNGRVPVVVGGDDSLLFPVARGIHDALPGRIGIIHFDAHLDLMDESELQGRHSQSSGMRRSLELERIASADCIQVCERHFNFPASGQFKHDNDLVHLSARDVLRLGAEESVARILQRVARADHLFLSFDIDSVDPAFAPGAGAHEPGGISSDQALHMVELLAPHCAAMAITEVNPTKDVGDMTSTLAAYLAFTFAVYGSQTK
ncbi:MULTISPECIES: arginase family protein [Brenneria]|uniref:Arginase n=1 Tax=Brenneria nigrifluens DSM 30175 = ATCC 13028 TaxID=1121120 RepID=A0A2U1UR55_9GAMM|nr:MULTISPECIES: arginase family protein [Brenneria]EHD22253.1 Agmatinase [Brenneria sp. EniD312]PWC24082.1 arginase [Brenneria nigrifluens] [Brenneria nigrifluens DSM 30175 = ATCC 13028]QCR05275.1 arginase family protein [Brenneria nigrifluens] [Brenneria nigrifluens DSM 30175 = ATCC 13028]